MGQSDYLEGESMSNIRFISKGAVNPESTGNTALVQVFYYVSPDDNANPS